MADRGRVLPCPVAIAVAATRYDRDVAPFARPFAAAIVRSLRLNGDERILDFGAGTGLITKALHRKYPGLSVTALDPSAEFLSGLADEPNTEVIVGGAGAVPPLRFDVVASNLVLMFCADPVSDLSLLRAASRPGASLAATVLGRAFEVEPFHRFWSAAAAVVPGAWSADCYGHHRLGDPQRLADVVAAAGWRDVQVRPVVGCRRIGAEAAWRWLVSALPVGVTGGGRDSYGPLDECRRDRVHRQFVGQWPSRPWPLSTALLVSATA